MTNAAILYQQKKQAAEKEGKSVSKGTLQDIVSTIERERVITENTNNLDSIRTRVTRSNVTGVSQSSKSPLNKVEKIVVNYCIRLAQIGSALKKEQFSLSAEDLIHQTKAATDLVQFKQ
jgi:hypothetical protein